MKSKFLMLPLLAGLVASPALAQQTTKPAADRDAAAAMMTVDTPTFVKQVMSSNAFEIQSSKLAEQKVAEAPKIDDFAKKMVTDHTKAGEDLKAALKEAKGDMQAPEAKLSPKHAAMMKLLEAADGKEFKQLYLDMQAGAHREAVALFRTYAASGDDPALKAFAKATLPTLEMHQEMVKDLVAAS